MLIADKKIQRENEIGSISFDYNKKKLHGIIEHVIFGVSGSTDTFEFFVDEIKERDVTFDNVTNVIAEHALDINKKRDFYKQLYFDLIVAIQHANSPTTLTNKYGNEESNVSIT